MYLLHVIHARYVFIVYISLLKITSFLITGVPAETINETAVTDNKGSGKSKKRATWKGKTEFSHPWLLKNLKGHPGTVILVDFSANGKFMAATCDGKFL